MPGAVGAASRPTFRLCEPSAPVYAAMRRSDARAAKAGIGVRFAAPARPSGFAPSREARHEASLQRPPCPVARQRRWPLPSPPRPRSRPPFAGRRGLHGAQRRDGAADRRALHLRGLQLLSAGRPMAVAPEVRPERGRPRLPRRLLGPARLEGPLRQPGLHRPPGGAAGGNGARFSYTPQVVVDGRDRKDWPGIAMPLGGSRPAAPVDLRAGPRRRAGHRDRGGRRPLTEAARRLVGGHRAGPCDRRQGRRKQRRDAAARLRGARLPDRAGLVAARRRDAVPRLPAAGAQPRRRRGRAR